MVCVPPDTDAGDKGSSANNLFGRSEEIPCRKHGNETRKERQPKNVPLLSCLPLWVTDLILLGKGSQ